MAEIRDENYAYTVDRRRRRGGGTIFLILVIAALIVALLFASGFWRMHVTDNGALPKVQVSTTDGRMPSVDVKSKQVTVGSKKETVDVPTVHIN